MCPCFIPVLQLKETGNSLGFNLVADIVSVVNWNQVVQWYESYHTPEVKSNFERCLFLLFIQAFAAKKHVEVLDNASHFQQKDV